MLPNGLQRHVLWDMDGRQWLEVITPEDLERDFFKHAVERGLVTVISQERLTEFVESIYK
jgi:hypothetical protein